MKTEKQKLALYLTALGLAGLVVMVWASPAHAARDLETAANTVTKKATTIAQSLSTLGVITGGMIMQIPGGADMGRKTLKAGLFGCLCSFGGPAFIKAIQSIFGVG